MSCIFFDFCFRNTTYGKLTVKKLHFFYIKDQEYLDATVLALQFLVLQPRVDRGEPEGTSLKELIKDPYIIIAAG